MVDDEDVRDRMRMLTARARRVWPEYADTITVEAYRATTVGGVGYRVRFGLGQGCGILVPHARGLDVIDAALRVLDDGGS